MACDQQHPLAEIVEFEGVEVVARFEGPEPVPEPLADRLAARERPGLEQSLRRHDEHHVLRVMAHGALEIPLVDGLELVPDDLDVLARHGGQYLAPGASLGSRRWKPGR